MQKTHLLFLSMVLLSGWGGTLATAADSTDQVHDATSADAIARARQAFPDGLRGPDRVAAAKKLYPLVRAGMTKDVVISLLGGPDRLNRNSGRFWGYSIGKDQEIEVEFDSSQVKVACKRETGLGIDPPPGPPSAISETLRPYLKDYAAADTTLRAGFIPYKPELVWGEPLEVTFKVDNLGPKDFEFSFGGDYRGTGRPNRIKVEVVDAAGKLLPDPHANAPDFGGMMSEELLTPGGQGFSRTFDLNQFRTIDKPGEYTVTCRFALDGFKSKPGSVNPVVSSRFHLAILERTPERVAKVLDELMAKAKSAPDGDLAATLALIARFGQDDAVPRLVRLAETGTLPQRTAAYAALPLVPTEASLQAALAGLKDVNPVIRASAAGALGAMQKPQGVEALLAALPAEKSPTAETVLIALGSSKSARALPVIADQLAQGTPELKTAAVAALVAFGGQEAVAELKKHLDTTDMGLRYQLVLALAEKLHQPMNPDWLLPVLMGRMNDHGGWLDSLRLMRMYGGDRAVPTLLSCLDFDAAWSGRNRWILNAVGACPKTPAVDYAYDPNSDGTQEQWEKNRQTLQRLKALAGPIPVAMPRPKKESVAYLVTDPPIDFKPQLKLVAGAIEIQSGFLKLTINRNGCSYPYSPGAVYLPLYQLSSDMRALLGRPEQFKSLGITQQQIEQLRKLPLPPDHPIDRGWTQLCIAYKDAPAGPLQEQAADDLGESVRAASQAYHAAHTAFVDEARRILTATQIEQLPAALKGKAETAPAVIPSRSSQPTGHGRDRSEVSHAAPA